MYVILIGNFFYQVFIVEEEGTLWTGWESKVSVDAGLKQLKFIGRG